MLSIEGQRAYSYNTCIKDVLPGGRTIGNGTRYSNTTLRHQDKVNVWDCDIVVDSVPENTYYLAEWFMDRLRELGICDCICGRVE